MGDVLWVTGWWCLILMYAVVLLLKSLGLSSDVEMLSFINVSS